MHSWLHLFDDRNGKVSFRPDCLCLGDDVVEVRNGIPRFVTTPSYSEGNFEKLRERHATLQLDSKNGLSDRYDTLMKRTGWPEEYFRGKLVLECGCGAGPDTEILLSLGARVVSVDLAGVDVARENVGSNSEHLLIQADITHLPFKDQIFDIVFCHRVIQHTPEPKQTLDHILRFVKPHGGVFVHSYARSMWQLLRWKYVLRPMTKRLPSEKLYSVIEKSAPFWFRLTNAIEKISGGFVFNHVVIPFDNKRGKPKFSHLSDEEIIAYGVHDTFDALAPKYDRPMSKRCMARIAQDYLEVPFEIVGLRSITLLRTICRPENEDR